MTLAVVVCVCVCVCLNVCRRLLKLKLDSHMMQGLAEAVVYAWAVSLGRKWPSQSRQSHGEWPGWQNSPCDRVRRV